MGPMWIHWGGHFLILNFTVYSTETGFLGIRGTLFLQTGIFSIIRVPMELSAKFASVPPRLLLECFAQGQKFP